MFKEHAWSHFNRTGLTAADIDATAEVNDGKGKGQIGGRGGMGAKVAKFAMGQKPNYSNSCKSEIDTHPLSTGLSPFRPMVLFLPFSPFHLLYILLIG